MINMKSLLSISRAEARVTRRLVRYWIFLAFSYLLAFIVFIRYSFLHYYSSFSATAGLVCPKFLISIMGLVFLCIYSVGVVFLAFDVRARDNRERMSEILDSRPYSNLELVLGRFLGIFLPSWIPVVILGVLLELFGYLLVALGSPIGEPIEIYSLMSFVFMMSIPALAFAISVVFLVTLLVRNRLVASVILIIILGLVYAGIFMLPVYQAQLLDFLGILQNKFPSEIVFDLMDFDCVLQRFAILLASVGLLGLSAALHPRLDDGSRARSAVISSGLVILAVAAAVSVFSGNVSDMEKPDMWLDAHSAYGDAPVPDVLAVSGQVSVIPGKSLDLDLEISFKAPDSRPVKNAVFTLNPGQKVVKVTDRTGKALSFSHKNGLLDITLNDELGPGKETGFKISINGIPDKRFAYLKSTVDPRRLKTLYANTPLLGNESFLYGKDFVALMPCVRWLPLSGPESGRDDLRYRPRDFFNIDLYVSLPKGWLAAGPGRRNIVEEKGEYNIFHFSPPSPVPEAALIASEFESRSFDAEDVRMELLISRKHLKNIGLLAETGDYVREYITDKLKEAEEYGLPYPYDGLTMVEVPTILRCFGGGWRLDTIQALPGVLLLRELSLPTARFDSAFRNPESFKDREGGLARAKWENLLAFFKNDLSGGNILTGASRNFFMFQTSATGPESLAVNFLTETLSGLILTDTKAYFSAHIFANERLNSTTTYAIVNYQQQRTAGLNSTISDTAVKSVTSRPEIWDMALENSLAETDPWKDPENTVDLLALKGYAISDSIYKILGREKTAEFLSIIRRNHTGGSFTLNDMVNAGKDIGCDLDEMFGDWTGSTELPGFIVSSAEIYRIPDAEDGNPRYQILAEVRNEESAPGIFRFIYHYPSDKQGTEVIESEAIRLGAKSALQYGSIVSRVPSSCFLAPYISLNRDKFNIKFSSIDHKKIVSREPVEGVKEIPFEIPPEESIVVDDLDKGFTVAQEEEKEGGFRLRSLISREVKKDQGLVRIPFDSLLWGMRAPGEWGRLSNSAAWGKYRHTTALIRAGKGEKQALFSTGLPGAGAWDLEIYLPMKSLYPGKKLGTFYIEVIDSSGDKYNLEFDSGAGNEGWNLVDKLDLPEGEITVRLSDETDGDLVVADAIRWTKSAGI